MAHQNFFLDSLEPTWRNRIFYVYGLGASGSATARCLHQWGMPVYVYDDSPEKRQAFDRLCPNLTHCAPEKVDWSAVGVMVLSPGIPAYDTPNCQAPRAVHAAREAGVAILSDLELFSYCIDARKIIAVTGTNGKSTTCAMLAHFLNSMGRRTALLGNIGVPVFDVLLAQDKAPYDYVVIECSSFQLDSCVRFHPAIAVWTNIASDHLDRHGTMARYVEAKRKIFTSPAEQSTASAPEQKAVITLADKASQQTYRWLRETRPWLSCVTIAREDCHGISVDILVRGDTVEVRGDTYHGSYARADYSSQKGAANALNFASCLGALWQLGHLALFSSRTLPPFGGLAHRQEIVTAPGAPFRVINDSKATNFNSVATALEGYPSCHLLLGGMLKDDDITPLKPFFTGIHKIYLFGQDRARLRDLLSAADYEKIYVAETLDACVLAAWQDIFTYPERTLLFSPGCASFDQFQNFEHRGRYFREVIRALARPKSKAVG